MTIGAVAYRRQLQAERTSGLDRISAGRGRVLTGFGGDLAGYNQSLIQKRADLEDQVMQKKYDNGEITLDELVTHLKKAATRSWVSVEQRDLLMEEIQSLEQNKLDEVIASQYKNGQITARQVAAYSKSKLGKLNPSSPLAQQLQAEISGWEEKANQEDIDLEERRILAEASAKEDGAEQQLFLEKSYNELADKANAMGFKEEAYGYTVKANEAKFKIDAYKEQSAATTSKQDRENLVGDMNLLINDYHDGRVDATTFLGQLDQLESKAVSSGYSDLLDDMNKWVDAVREDMVYGKAWDRGGTRIGRKSTGTGTGGTGWRGASGGDWETNEQQYKNNVKELQNKLATGQINGDQYKAGLSEVMADRVKDVSDYINHLSDLDDATKVVFNGTKKKVGDVIESLTAELEGNWGKPLGLSETEAGKAGLVAMANDIANYPGSYVPVMNVSGAGPGARGNITLQLLTPELQNSSVADTAGVYHKVMEDKLMQKILSQDEYMALPESEKLNYGYDAAGGTWNEKKKSSKRYVDVYSNNGDMVRYYVDANNRIVDWEPNIAGKDSLPDGFGGTHKDFMDVPTNFDTPNYIEERAKEKRQQEIAAKEAVATALPQNLLTATNIPTATPTTTPTSIGTLPKTTAPKITAPKEYIPASSIPNNLNIKDQPSITNTSNNGGGSIAQPTEQKLTTPTQTTTTATNLKKALGNTQINLGPAPTQSSLDKQYEELKKKDAAMFATGNASGQVSVWDKIKKTVSGWFGR